MEVGNISIVGKLDVSSITDSLSQLNNSLGKTKDIAKNSFGDIENLSKGLSGIATGLTGIGIAAGTALIGLAAAGPYTAGAIARMNVSMGEMERTVSSALAPAFEAFADLMGGFSTWLSSPDGTAMLDGFNTVLLAIMSSLKLIIDPAEKAYEAIKNIVNIGGKITDTIIEYLPVPEETKKGIKGGIQSAISPSGITDFIVSSVMWPLEALSNTLGSINSFASGDILGGLGQAGQVAIDLPTAGWGSKVFETAGNLVNSSLEGWGSLGYPGGEQQFTQELADKSRYTIRYIGDVD